MSKIVTATLGAMVFGLLSSASSTYACSPKTDCKIGDRTYRIRMPEGHDGKTKVGAIIFNHGYRGSAKGLMRNKRLGKMISKMGLAFVAPKSLHDDWDIPNAPSPGKNTELAFFDALKVDLTVNHFVDPDKIMVSGFSAGGMMTWNLACERGDIFAAFAPISGTFWAPVPKSCPTLPVSLIHMHGTADKIVPLKGRKILDAHQGEIMKAIALATPEGRFKKWGKMPEKDGLTCQETKESSGKFVRLCFHPGGHTFQSKWLKRAWQDFDKAGAFGS